MLLRAEQPRTPELCREAPHLLSSRMQTAELFGSTIEFDFGATANGYRHLEIPNARCCSACAAFTEIVQRKALPPDLTTALRRLGIDPAKPQEVYGVPEAGYLAGWWLFVGKLHTIWAGEAAGAFEEISPGLRCWVTDRLVVHSWQDVTQKTALVQVEFDWQGEGLAQFASYRRTGRA